MSDLREFPIGRQAEQDAQRLERARVLTLGGAAAPRRSADAGDGPVDLDCVTAEMSPFAADLFRAFVQAQRLVLAAPER